MKILFGVLLLLILAVFIEGNTAEKELNLNFLQNDYQVKFERLELVRYNKNLLKDAKIVTFKCNRTAAVVNTTFTPKVDLGYDVVNIIQAYKFMSNEYRSFPMRFAANLCKSLAANVAGIASGSMKCGNFTGCPLVKGKRYHICNWYPEESKLPPYMPSGQYMIEIQVLHLSTELSTVHAYLTIFRPIV